MKVVWSMVLLLMGWILVAGAPFAEGDSKLDYRYNSPEAILPMTFAHLDHTTVSCVECHHNYQDDTGRDPCMICHVTDQTVWPKFEEQFHDLCRGCHRRLERLAEPAGPTGRCAACHTEDQAP